MAEKTEEKKKRKLTHACFIKIAGLKEEIEAIRDYYVTTLRNAVNNIAPGCVFMYADSSPLSVADKELIACCLGNELVYDVNDVVNILGDRFRNTGYHSRPTSAGDIYDAGGNVAVAPAKPAATVSVVPQKKK